MSDVNARYALICCRSPLTGAYLSKQSACQFGALRVSRCFRWKNIRLAMQEWRLT